jgi:hypothetical protein
MTFEDILDHAMAMLQRRGRVSYRILRRQFALDDHGLDDLTEAMRFANPRVVDEDGRGLVWTSAAAAPEPDAQHRTDAESRFHALLPDVIGLLQRERRVTHRRLTYVFGLDKTLLEDIREELNLATARHRRSREGSGLDGRNASGWPRCCGTSTGS